MVFLWVIWQKRRNIGRNVKFSFRYYQTKLIILRLITAVTQQLNHFRWRESCKIPPCDRISRTKNETICIWYVTKLNQTIISRKYVPLLVKMVLDFLKTKKESEHNSDTLRAIILNLPRLSVGEFISFCHDLNVSNMRNRLQNFKSIIFKSIFQVKKWENTI